MFLLTGSKDSISLVRKYQHPSSRQGEIWTVAYTIITNRQFT